MCNNIDNISDIDLAEQLFNTQVLGVDIESKYKTKVNQILKECTSTTQQYPERQQVLLKIIELIGEPQNPKERYLIAKAYAWSKVNYREKAIYYLELYLNNELYHNAYKYIKHNLNNTIDIEKKYHIHEMKQYLAEAYAGLYNFEKALQIYEEMIIILPNNPIGYVGKVEILTKQNNLKECQKWLQQIKKTSPYYKVTEYKTELGQSVTDDWFYKSINKLLKETNLKIKNGYIYKPKKERRNDI